MDETKIWNISLVYVIDILKIQAHDLYAIEVVNISNEHTNTSPLNGGFLIESTHLYWKFFD
jgi:hypothetical protein